MFAERREKMVRVGEIYRAVRAAFPETVEITIVDPRNFVSFIPLVVRDAVRFHVPWLTAIQSMGASSLSTGIFDGQVLYSRQIPAPAEVVELIRHRMRVDRVGELAAST